MLEYLKTHILEEIDGAMDYYEKALERKGTPCGATFFKMASMEVEHANALTKMFTDKEKPESVTEAEYFKMHKEILDKYADSMAKIEHLKKLYWS